MMAKPLKLYQYWRSSCSWRVRWALNIKKVPYETIAVDLLKGEQSNENYHKLNPAGFVPALEVDGQVFAESLGILEWLEETYPLPRLLPEGALDRMRVRQLAYTVAMGIAPIQNLAVQRHFSGDKDQRIAWARHWIARGFKVFEALLADSMGAPFSFGDQVSLADLCLIPQVYNANRFGVAMNAYPKIKAINERCLATKACAKARPEHQPGAQ
jgi:maleylacetoacetate isomerase